MKKRKPWLMLCFVALSAASLLLFWLVPLRGQKEISATENRALEKLPAFSTEAFLSGAYQDELEKAAGDQLLFSEEIRSFVREAEASALSAGQRLLGRLNPDLRGGYTQIADGYYAYRGDEHRIVEKPELPDTAAEDLTALAEPLRDLPGVRRYLYLIGNSRMLDFDRPETGGDILQAVLRAYGPDGAACLLPADYEEYCHLFYQTDHHWNDEGFYRGYTEILALLKPEESPIGPGERHITDTVFNGSYARITKSLRADEPFIIRSFDLPKHSVTLNGKRGAYGRLKAYLAGRYAAEPLTNHYANCYGGDYGEIIYDFGTEGRGRLLIIANSYSNPINALIASHYDQTRIIDPRYYEAYAGQPFDPAGYASEHGIDTLLLLGDIRLFLPGSEEEGGG